jgi:hypothetical protein
VAPVALGVRLKVNGAADRPVTTGDGRVTVQATDVVVPETKVATTLGAVEPPAVKEALVELQATPKSKAGGYTVIIWEVFRVWGVGVVESVTVSATVKGPAVAYAWVGLCRVDVVPSPKSQAKE